MIHLAILLGVLGFGQEPHERVVASQAERASHERMLERLGALARATDRENPYLGTYSIGVLRQALAGGLPPLREAEARHQLGLELLRVGRTEEALTELEAVRAALGKLAEPAPPSWAGDLTLELGLAALRLAENRNCIANHSPESCLFPLRGGGLHVDREGSTRAIGFLREAETEAPAGSPAALAARWLLNVAHMTLGTWPEGLTPEELIAPELLRSRVEFPRFPDVAAEAGVDFLNLAGGAIAEDFDADGWLDLVITDSEPRSQARFLHNTGGGHFEDRTAGSGLEGIGGGLNAVQADYDDDGRIDFLILRGAWWASQGKHPNSLLRNLGDGRFVDVTHLAGLADPALPTQVGSWADCDLDGDLDLYVANEAAPSQLFLNQGDGRFVDGAAEAGVENNQYAKGACWGDYDGDRYPDLYVSNIGARNRLFHNRGDGHFENVAGKLGVSMPRDSFATWFFDYDQDGDLDLFVTSYDQSVSHRLAPVVASTLGLAHEAESARLYRNDGRGGFADVTQEAGLGQIKLPMGANFGDLDGDGYPDFYLGTGYPGFDALMPNVMYWNRSGKGFVDVSEAGGFGHLQKGHGVAFADLDDDGDQDVFEELGGAYPGDAARNVLFQNPGFGTHWLKVTLQGRRSARCAIGTRIEARVREGEATRSVYAWVGSGGSFGANPLAQHLGLGHAERVESLQITWPVTGAVQRLENPPMDVHIEVVEGVEGYTVRSKPRAPSGGD